MDQVVERRKLILFKNETEKFFLLFALVYFNLTAREFPGGPVVRILCLHCKGHGFDPWSGS